MGGWRAGVAGGWRRGCGEARATFVQSTWEQVQQQGVYGFAEQGLRAYAT
jgi:hypothetical protein